MPAVYITQWYVAEERHQKLEQVKKAAGSSVMDWKQYLTKMFTYCNSNFIIQ